MTGFQLKKDLQILYGLKSTNSSRKQQRIYWCAVFTSHHIIQITFILNYLKILRKILNIFLGHVAALVRSHAIGLLPIRNKQTTQTMDPSPKTIELLHYPGQWNLELTGSCYSTDFSSRGSILLVGDFNSRTGKYLDVVSNRGTQRPICWKMCYYTPVNENICY